MKVEYFICDVCGLKIELDRCLLLLCDSSSFQIESPKRIAKEDAERKYAHLCDHEDCVVGAARQWMRGEPTKANPTHRAVTA